MSALGALRELVAQRHAGDTSGLVTPLDEDEEWWCTPLDLADKAILVIFDPTNRELVLAALAEHGWARPDETLHAERRGFLRGAVADRTQTCETLHHMVHEGLIRYHPAVHAVVEQGPTPVPEDLR